MNKIASPFPTIPRRKNRKNKSIDPDLLQISDDKFIGKRSSPDGKYDELFSRLKPGQCLKCEPDEAASLAHALRNWLKKRHLIDTLDVRSMSKYHTDQRGRVWLMQREQKLRKAA